MLVFVRGVGAVSVYDQPGDELLWLSKWCPIGVNLVSMDREHIELHYDRGDIKVNGHFLSYSSVCSMVQLCQNIILI
ncbi:hypothetical protein F2Q70_00025724 [Brassica cretica]|uniref:Uncharacterized protein n=1 Tax=Brassica cretica TaxID=69181 RepID=A0A8S9L4Y2_BRACR|nr:hypothetical protein F2Q70_00025724 [Brassica cretica]